MSSRRTLREYEDGASATTWDELNAACRKFTFGRGFDHYRVSIVSKEASLVLFDPPYAAHNYPTGYRRAIKSLPGFDPVAEAFIAGQLSPCVWDQSFYAEAGALERWLILAKHGLAQGVTVATIDRERPRLSLSVSSGTALPQSRDELNEVAAEVLLFAYWIAPAIHALMDRASHDPLLDRIERGVLTKLSC